MAVDTQENYLMAQPNNPIRPDEMVVEKADPLTLDIEDSKLAKIIDKRIRDSRIFFANKYHLFERRRKNEMYLFGRQIQDKEERHDMKIYEARYLDNALYEIEASLKPLAMNKLPDLIVTPGNDTQQSKDTAESISTIVDSDIKKRNNRVVLGIAFKHRPVYFTGVIKARWNPELTKYGDYGYEVVHPDNIDVDHTCPTNNADDMAFIAQSLPITVQECIMRFPEAKEQLFDELKKQGITKQTAEFSEQDLASEIKIKEVWFKWYTKAETGQSVQYENEIPVEPGNKWEEVRGVIWKYGKVILKKIKNPNFDYEGEEQIFTYDDPSLESSKRPVSEQELMMGLAGGPMPNIQRETVYRNYFERPRVPYFLMGYDQWHKIPYDETSHIEQNIRNQENLDKRGKIIQETLDERGKHVFSKDGGLSPDDIENMDMNDPNQDLLLEGDVNKTHGFIPPRVPSPQEFKDMEDTRNRMYGVAGSNAIRGQIQSDVATTNQIARESDYTRADDVVEDTINAAAEWMAQWAMQFIKLRYTEEHMRKVLGNKGDVAFIALKNDMIDDGMEVMIKASGTDKQRAQNNALEMAKLQLIDPFKFYEDMGLSDPEGRSKYLLSFLRGAMDGYSSYELLLQGVSGVPQMVDQMLGPGAAQQLQQQPPISAGPDQPIQPANPTPTNTANVPIAPPVGTPVASPRTL